MLLLNSYVTSFTSVYSKKAAERIINNDSDKTGFEIIKTEEGDVGKFFLSPKKEKGNSSFLPYLTLSVSEKVDGSLVYVRMDSKKGKKSFMLSLFSLFTVALICLVVLAVKGIVHFAFPVAFGIALLLALRLTERAWAKTCCIKSVKKFGEILGYTPEKVIIFKVKKS